MASRLAVLTGVAVLWALTCAPAVIAATPTVTEFRIPSSMPFSQPHGIVTGWDGNLWFTQHGRNAIGRIPPTAASGAEISEVSYGIPGEGAYGAEGIAAGPDGRLWFTLNDGVPFSDFWLGSLTQGASPAAAYHELGAADPQPREIAAGRDGRLWFTRGTMNALGRISPVSPFEDGHFTIALPPAVALNSLKGIAAGPDGNLWFTWGDKVGRATTASTPVITIFETGWWAEGIAAGPDGNLWFTRPPNKGIGRITPAGAVTTFDLPASLPYPFRIVAGPDGNLWFTDGDSSIGRITPHGSDAAIQASIAEFGPVTVPSFTSTGIAAGPDGAIWFARTDSAGRMIGRISTALDPPHGRTALGGPPIAVPGVGSANPYPSTVTLSGLPSHVDGLRVDLHGLFHAWPEDLDLLLVGPEGQKALLLSDAGSDRSVFGSSLTVDADAPFAAPLNGILVSGRYRPTDHEPGESLPPPAPPGPYGTDLSVFDGTDPNGVWSLYVADDASGFSGRLLGWGLRVTPSSPEDPPGEDPPGEGPADDRGGSRPPGGTGPAPSGPAAARRAGFVAGTRQVLVDTGGRALVELSCPAGEKRACAVRLGATATVPKRGRKGGPRRRVTVPAHRFAVPAGRVRVARLPLPRRLRRALGPGGPRLRLVAVDRGSRASATVSLRPAMAEVRPARDGRVRVLVPHAGDAKRLRVRVVQAGRTLARGRVARPRRGRVVPLRIRLDRRPRGSRPLRIVVTTVPIRGERRTLAYRVRPVGAGT